VSENDIQLRAVVASRSGGVEAQLLEIDIAARAESVDGLLKEIAHALVVTYDIAAEAGEAPFFDIKPAPADFHARFENNKGGSKVEYINLPDQVAVALATALHARKPIRKIAVTVPTKAAA